MSGICAAPGCGVLVRRGRCITHALAVLVDGDDAELLHLVETSSGRPFAA